MPSDKSDMVQKTEPSILQRTAAGAGWLIGWRFATRLLGFCSTLVLVRVLTPEDFGLVALATSIIFALDVALSAGIEDQIIRATSTSRELYDTAFTLNLIRCLLIAGIVFASATPAARYFNEPRLEVLLHWFTVYVALLGLANIYIVDFRRELNFHKEFVSAIVPRVTGIIFAIIFALALRSYWALVIGLMANRIVALAMSYAMHPGRPRLSLALWRTLLAVSGWTWAISTLQAMKDRIDSFAVGRHLGSQMVGVFNVGWEIATLPITETIDPICRACMPGFAATKRVAPQDTSNAFRRIVSLLALFTLPAGIGISSVSAPVVAIAFGSGWSDAIPVITIIGIATIGMLFGNVSQALLSAHALLPHMLVVFLFGLAVRVSLLTILISQYQLLGAALAAGIAVMMESAVMFFFASRAVGLRPTQLLRGFLRPVIATSAMALVLWMTGLGWSASPPSSLDAAFRLISAIAVGASTYVITAVSLWALGGRPDSAEVDAYRALSRAVGYLVSRITPRRA